MFKLLRNLKSSILYVVIIVLLLCVQAWADLTLPDYTSKIVNTGIQAGGIENPSPEVIKKSQMDNLLLFTKEDESILSKYTLISKDSLEEKEYEKYTEKYPALENEDLYIVNKLSEEEQETLNDQIAKPLLILSNLSNEETAKQIKMQIISSMQESNAKSIKEGEYALPGYPSTSGISPEILEQMSLIEILKAMPEEKLDQMIETAQEQVNQMSESIISQAAIVQVKNEYKQIGMDTDKIQNNYIFMAGLQMLGVAFVSMASAIIVMFLSAKVAAMLGRTLRDKVFKKVMDFLQKNLESIQQHL